MTARQILMRVIATIPPIANVTQAMMDMFRKHGKVKIAEPVEERVNQELRDHGVTKQVEMIKQNHLKEINLKGIQEILAELAHNFEGIDENTFGKMYNYIRGGQWSYTVMEVKYTTPSPSSAVYLMIVVEKKDELYNFSYVGCTVYCIENGTKELDIRNEIHCKLFTNIDQDQRCTAFNELENFIRYLVTREFKYPEEVVKAINDAKFPDDLHLC